MKYNTAAISVSAILLWFALQPVISNLISGPVYAWISYVFIFIVFICLGSALLKDRKEFIKQVVQRDKFDYIDAIIIALGLILALIYKSDIYECWITLVIIALLNCITKVSFKKDE